MSLNRMKYVLKFLYLKFSKKNQVGKFKAPKFSQEANWILKQN